MKFNINAGLVAAVATFRAEDDIRYYLAGVYIEPIEGGGVMIAATQGHAMCMWRDVSGFSERPSILSVTNKLLKVCKKNPSACLTINDGRLSVINAETSAEIYTSPTEKPGDWEIEANYPDIRRVIPEDGIKQFVEPFNPSYINLAKKALKIVNPDGLNLVSISQFAKHGPLAISSAGHPDFFVVLMPIREDRETKDIPQFAVNFKASKLVAAA